MHFKENENPPPINWNTRDNARILKVFSYLHMVKFEILSRLLLSVQAFAFSGRILVAVGEENILKIHFYETPVTFRNLERIIEKIYKISLLSNNILLPHVHIFI